MGTFAEDAARHLDLHGADGAPLGPFASARGGRTLACRFGKAVATGTRVRVYVDRSVRVVAPASSYQGPNTLEPQRDPRLAGVAVGAVVGARQIANGWVLDLQVPSSANPPDTTAGAKMP
jgi:hypothetical protein